MGALKLLATSNSAPASTPYVDDVFSTYLYTGSGATKTVTTGINLSANAGMVWIKDRSTTEDHSIYDTVRGPGNALRLGVNGTAASTTGSTGLTAFSSTGFTLGSGGRENTNGSNLVAWTFRKATKFFDVVTWVGDGTLKSIPHSLGLSPGMIIVKPTDSPNDWRVYHRSLFDDSGNPDFLSFNLASAPDTGGGIFGTPDASNFVMRPGFNVNGRTYVAYLFAHDTAADGIIQCGEVTTDGSGKANVNLGWEPQFVITRKKNTSYDWKIFDNMRGWIVDTGGDKALKSNGEDAEYANQAECDIRPNGIEFNGSPSTSYIYIAIRRPNKPPTTGTQVYNAISRSGTGANATVSGVGFTPDSVLCAKLGPSSSHSWGSRLLGPSVYSRTSSTNAEFSETNVLNYTMDGYKTVNPSTMDDINWSSGTYINYFFKRAVGFFDIICYTGNGATQTHYHNLGGVPELAIIKSRTSSTAWRAAFGLPDWTFSNTYSGGFSTAAVSSGSLILQNVTSTSFEMSQAPEKTAGTNYIVYLFKTLAGISKVGTYIGNGTSLTIDCGFSAGVRFILIRAVGTGDWFIWDSVRGIVAGNDPHISLNSSGSEISTDDSVDPVSNGFIVNQVAATNINVNTTRYLFLAIA